MTWKVKLCGKTYMVLDDEGWYVMSCQDEQRAQFVASAPKMQEALKTIAEGAIVSSEQSPEKIAEQVLRVLRIAREAAAEYMVWVGMQQKRAERAEAALESIRDMAECILQPLTGPSVSRARWEKVRDRAVAAIAVAKGEDDEDVENHNDELA